MENNPLLSKKENKVWQPVRSALIKDDYNFITTLPNLMGTLLATIENRGFFGNLFKNRETGILGFKKYVKNIEKASESFAIYDSIFDGIKYLKNFKNSPKGELSKENKLKEKLFAANIRIDLILRVRHYA